jgi:xylitol oxidase
VTELRTIAADELWMSPHHHRASLGLHFTWRRDPAGVAEVLPALEAALAPFGARPHWGKVFAGRPPRLERADDFAALAAALDPRGAFRNEWLSARL